AAQHRHQVRLQQVHQPLPQQVRQSFYVIV
ncbi:unnamed protein product, partial [Didymodactylos carnosus]